MERENQNQLAVLVHPETCSTWLLNQHECDWKVCGIFYLRSYFPFSLQFNATVDCRVMLTGWRRPGEVWSDAEGVTDGQPGVRGVLQRSDANTTPGLCTILIVIVTNKSVTLVWQVGVPIQQRRMWRPWVPRRNVSPHGGIRGRALAENGFSVI